MNLWTLFQNDYTLRIVSLGAGLLGLISGMIGSFAVIKKQGLLGDAVSHASLPGIALMFLVFQSKNTFLFMLGALGAGLLATLMIYAIEKYTRIKIDSAMALILSVFFGLGLMLMTYIQKIPNANQAGLEKFIFGQASTLLRRDVYIIVVAGAVILFLMMLFWKELKIASFDPDFADSLGFCAKKISLLLSFMIVVSIIIGLQTVGVILMSAMLIAPGVSARQWTNKLSVMVMLAGIFGGLSGLIGTLISSLIAKMPTGPSIVLVMSVIVLISVMLAPERGLLMKKIRKEKNKQQINEERILLNLYDLWLNHGDLTHSHSVHAISPICTKRKKECHNTAGILKELQKRGQVKSEYFNEWHLTEKGKAYIEQSLLQKEGAYESAN